jgi:hypothetical protein
MLLLIASAFVEDDTSVAFPLLLVATAFLGVGFGLTVPALNTLTAAFHPAAIDSSVLVLNALLGLGTALAPVFVAIFIGLGFWWGLPVTSAILLTLLLGLSLGLPLRAEAPSAGRERSSGIPSRFWMFAGFATLYGICETVNGNWSQLDMTRELGASTTVAALALTAFWAMLTVGRIGVAAIERWVSVRVTYRILPFVLAVTFVLIALLGEGDSALGVLAFGLAGLGCSALLPLTISFGQGSWPRSPRRWPAASSPSTKSVTASPRSASGRWSTAASHCPPCTRPAPPSRLSWDCWRSRSPVSDGRTAVPTPARSSRPRASGSRSGRGCSSCRAGPSTARQARSIGARIPGVAKELDHERDRDPDPAPVAKVDAGDPHERVHERRERQHEQAEQRDDPCREGAVDQIRRDPHDDQGDAREEPGDEHEQTPHAATLTARAGDCMWLV